MLFNSFEFIFFFLPIVFLVYFFLNKKRLNLASKSWLVGSSLFFYSWWNLAFLPLILISLFFNYAVGSALSKVQQKVSRKAILLVGLTFNVGLLAYYKYTDFFIYNINVLFTTNISLFKLALPLAISFFTFQQIAYLVDAFRYETKEYDFLNYALFVTFFPQLIAGPIVHHKEMIPQFKQLRNKIINYRNIATGVFIFTIGLFKKVAIADNFSIIVNSGFDQTQGLSFIEGWIVSLSYTMQLYFDFSGYTDMAIGVALLFNIKLPTNFNSPYKALNIQDFWKRWHITLSRFLTQYIYIPLGGNRYGKIRTYLNILIVYLVSGFWHGAGWTFIFWGFLHGFATIIYRFWSSLNLKLHKPVAWFITFNFVNISWVFFRAETWSDAINVLKSMIGINGFPISTNLIPDSVISKVQFFTSYGIELTNKYNITFGHKEVLLLIVCITITISLNNSKQMMNEFKPNLFNSLFLAFLFAYSILNLTKVSEFIYFNF